MIKINNEEIRIRPSAIEGFYGCAWQWGKHFLEGVNSMPNSRAAIGTAIHAGIENIWTENMDGKDKSKYSLSAATDAAIEAFKEEQDKGLELDEEVESVNSCHAEILAGTDTFLEDIHPFAKIPEAVEEFYTVPLSNPIVSEIGGTVDYIGHGVIADVKTSKRKPAPTSYTVQQSIYKFLAEENGVTVNSNLIHGIVLKKQPEGMILPLEPKVEYAKNLVNMMLDTLTLVSKDVAPIDQILRPNPKYMFCSQKFCQFYGKCPATKPLELQPTTIAKVKL